MASGGKWPGQLAMTQAAKPVAAAASSATVGAARLKPGAITPVLPILDPDGEPCGPHADCLLTTIPTSRYGCQTRWKMDIALQGDSKTRLLEATLRVVRAKGYYATRIEDICAEAG